MTQKELITPQATDGQFSALEKLKEKKEPSLGELNPLIYPPDLFNQEAVEAITLVATRKIKETNGLQPSSIDVAVLQTFQGPIPRLVARFEHPTLSEEKITLLEQIVHETYGTKVRTRKNTSGNPIQPSFYPTFDQKESGRKKTATVQSKMLGWYMGPNTDQLDSGHMGLLVFRDVESVSMGHYLKSHSPKEWFFRENLTDPITGKPLKTKYVVEIREAALYQTDLVKLIVQTASVLGNGYTLDNRALLYETYNDLNRLGLRKTGKEFIHGLDEQIDRLNRVLIYPLANLDASTSIQQRPGSALLVGVPGTGKTLIVEYFLNQDTGVFLVPLDPLNLAKELAQPPEKRTILPRISQVFKDTQIPIVIHLDDIENIAHGEEQINSTLLNLMQGVRDSGFFVIASTNFPEKLHDPLLQEQRFAHVTYFGLQDEEARSAILDIHATRVSRELGIPLFASEEERNTILKVIAANTKSFTPRYLEGICNAAKSYFLKRMIERKGKAIGLKEQDLRNETFSIEDWENGYREIVKKYDRQAVEKRDKELQEFARRHHAAIGFQPQDEQVVFSLQTEMAKYLHKTSTD